MKRRESRELCQVSGVWMVWLKIGRCLRKNSTTTTTYKELLGHSMWSYCNSETVTVSLMTVGASIN